MNGCQIHLRIDGDRQIFRPGETISGTYQLDAPRPEQIEAVELSVLWHTEGTGDEDLAVHFFERRSVEHGAAFDVSQPYRFSARLPRTPLSYDGVIVKLHWCVRARVFLRQGKDVLVDVPFQLGHVPSARPVEELVS